MSIVQIVKEQLEQQPLKPEVADMVLQLAAWEDAASAGELAVAPDLLAEIRHYIHFEAN